MSNSSRVLNVTTGAHPKLSQAKKKIAECEWGWVIEGESVRVLTAQESMAAWQKSEQKRAPLPCKEVSFVIERMPKSSVWTPVAKLGARLHAIHLAGSDRQKKRLSVPLSQYSASPLRASL